jgi:Na+/H+ antiporter NhaD/arsenite permease-like protein
MVLSLTILFSIGYLLILFEEKININKSAIALLLGGIMWLDLFLSNIHSVEISNVLMTHLQEISGVVFFLMGAMTIVELIDLNQGFDLIIRFVRIKNKRMMLLSLSLICFFMSSFLDNLTTAIILFSICSKIFIDPKEKMFSAGMMIIASNSGGAWSPMGDVTTTMLWVSEKISTFGIVQSIFIPSFVSMIIPYAIISTNFKGSLAIDQTQSYNTSSFFVFFLGIFLLFMVPTIHILTGIPPFLSMIICVGLFWIIMDIFQKKLFPNTLDKNTIYFALEQIDIPSLLFFLGILLSVAALEEGGVLSHFSNGFHSISSNRGFFVFIMGLVSALFDNVPMLAAIDGMYTIDQYPKDSLFWKHLAYSVGTGGSILLIGSAAGVAIMGSANLRFGWYIKNISLAALIGYLAGTLILLFF